MLQNKKSWLLSAAIVAGSFSMNACSTQVAEEAAVTPATDVAKEELLISQPVEPASNDETIIMSVDALKACGVLNPRGFSLAPSKAAPSGMMMSGQVSMPNPAWNLTTSSEEKDGSVTIILHTTPPAPDVQVMQVIADQTLKVMLPGTDTPKRVALACRVSD